MISFKGKQFLKATILMATRWYYASYVAPRGAPRQNPWAHINLHGEYNFTNYAENDVRFNVTQILNLDVA